MAAREKIRGLNDQAIGLLKKKDAAGFRALLDKTDDTICGRFGLSVLLELLPMSPRKPRPRCSVTTPSIDIPGFEDANSVSYVAMAFSEGPKLRALPPGPVDPPEVCP